jgi:Mg2+ and Co2+ transporter CorA
MFIFPFSVCHCRYIDAIAATLMLFAFYVTCSYPYNVTNVQKLHKPSSYKVFFCFFVLSWLVVNIYIANRYFATCG